MNNKGFDSDAFGSAESSEYEATEFSSKTELKQASEALKKLGLELISLTRGEREKLALDEELEDALELASRINRKKEGFRRQVQLIGKLLRKRDIAPITLGLDKLRNAHTHDVQKFHAVERLRDELLAKQDEALQGAIEKYPQLDRQKIRTLLRTANKEQKENKPPAASRALFKYLKEALC